MNSEYYICNHCKIKHTCHPKPLPIIVGRDGRAINVGKLHKGTEFSTRCARYTCSTDGEYVARQLMQDPSNFVVNETVTELDGLVHKVMGVILSTSEKQTNHGRYRILTMMALVYALQDGMYYFAQDLNE